MGCDDIDPGRSGGAAGDLGHRWNARMDGQRIVHPPDYSLPGGRFFGMKRNALSLPFDHGDQKDRPLRTDIPKAGKPALLRLAARFSAGPGFR